MPRQDYTRQLKAEARKHKISPEIKAFADLRIMGWDDLDAYTAAGLFDPILNLPTNHEKMQKLIQTAAFQSYQREREQANAHKWEEEHKKGEPDYRSKDSIIEQLGKLSKGAKTAKEKASILLGIADLQRMKQEEMKEEKRLVEFYVPLTCRFCPHYQTYGEPHEEP